MSELLQAIKDSLGEDLKGEKYGDAEAVIGVDHHTSKVIFSVAKQIQFLMDRDGMDHDEAKEYVYHNYVGARGSDEPIWLEDDFL